MNLDRVTITGADDSILPQELVAISKDFPFVEWGILVGTDAGHARFPSLDWISEFSRLAIDNDLTVSAHLCGRWIRDLVGNNLLTFWRDHTMLAYAARRVQLNWHGRTQTVDQSKLWQELNRYPYQWIFQVDGANDHLPSNAHDECVDAVPLYDLSGGAGIVPDSWPGAMAGIYSGYAGGLGPDTLEAQLPLIAQAARGEPCWVDMETRIRSEDDREFDLAKVRKCLEICAPLVVAAAV